MEVALLENPSDNMQRFKLQDRSKKPPLRIDVARTAGIVCDDFGSPATNGSYGNDVDKGYLSPRVMRSACDFCHTKRIKCKRDESDSPGGPCEQCKRRGIDCKFSFKEKTGPKPKMLHAPKDGSRFTRHSSASPSHYRSTSSRPVVRSSSAAPHPSRVRSQFSSLNTNYGSPMRMRSERRAVKQEPSPSSMKQIDTEHLFLRTYLNTVAQTLPFCEDEILINAMAEREAAPTPNSIPSSVAQAQLSGALAIGALIQCDRVAEFYHCAARDHLKNLFSAPSPEAASVLCMLAFYWQYRGDDEKKIVYVRHAKLGLEHPPAAPSLELHICMEYLDFDNAGHPRSDSHILPPLLRVLHVVSCMLGNIQVLMDPAMGLTPGIVYCRELGECSAPLRPGRGEDVPALLCTSLHAFLLVMLGRRAEAVTAILRIPAFLEACPDAPRALPLSWDTCLIAASLAFLLQLSPAYAVIHQAVECSQNATAATQWTCRLPVPGASPEIFLNHKCRSTSNICSIICQLWRQTDHGARCFYNESSEARVTPGSQSGLPSPSQANFPYRDLPYTAEQHGASSPHSYSRPPRPHREMSGASEFDDLSPDIRPTHLLNSNQASPIPYTPKRLRNSRASSPSGSLSPTVGQRWNDNDDGSGMVKDEGSSHYPSSPHLTSSPYPPPRRPPSQNRPRSGKELHTRSSPSLQSPMTRPSEDFHSRSSPSVPSPMNLPVQEAENTAALMQQMHFLSQGIDFGRMEGQGFGVAPNGFDAGIGMGDIGTPRGHHRRLSSALMELISTGNTPALLDDINGNGLLAGLGLNDEDQGYLCRGNSGLKYGTLPTQDSSCSEGMLALLDDSDLMGVLNEWGAGAESLHSSFPDFSTDNSDTRAIK